MKKRKLSILFMMGILVLSLFSFPALAGDIGPSASGEPTNQARIIAGVINARKLVYWSVWTDRAAAYARDPKNQPAPKWPTATEIKNQVGGETPEGFTFAETNMPAARDNSFRLVVTVASSRGGAAAAEKVTMFLPMAAVSGTKITIPVTRPADALAAGTLMSEYVRRDGTTPDGQSTVFSGKEVTLGEGARLHFQGAGGDIENVSSLTAKTVVAAQELQLSSGAGAKIQIGANGIPYYKPLNRSSWYSFITAENIASQAVSSAGKWATARKIALSGGAIAAGVPVDGTKDVTLNVTSLNAASLSGTINAERLPLSAPNMTVGSAEMAKYAQIATTATRAFQAGIATEAGRANYAASAGSAGYATNAGSASNANYATSAGSASGATGLSSSGYGNTNLTYYQTGGSFAGASSWAHYIIANHGDGASYYNYMLRLPFWSAPQIRYQMGSTGNTSGWQTLATEAYVKARKVYVNQAQSVNVNLPEVTIPLWSNQTTPLNTRVNTSSRVAGQPLGVDWSFKYYNGEVNTRINCYIASSSAGTNILVGSYYLPRQWNGYTGTYSISNTVYPNWSGPVYFVVKINSSDWDSTGGHSKLYASTPILTYSGKMQGYIE